MNQYATQLDDGYVTDFSVIYNLAMVRFSKAITNTAGTGKLWTDIILLKYFLVPNWLLIKKIALHVPYL